MGWKKVQKEEGNVLKIGDLIQRGFNLRTLLYYTLVLMQ